MVCKCKCAYICVKYNETLIWCHKSPVVYGKTFDFVKGICVEADGAPSLMLTPHFVLYVTCNK